MARGKPFEKGNAGRPKGAQNKLTMKAKEAFQMAFEELGGVDGMVKWARSDADNLKAFYTLYARLIPVDMTSGGEKIESSHIHITREVIHGATQEGRQGGEAAEG